MTVDELIQYLREECDPDTVVVIAEPNGSGWANIDRIRNEYGSTVDLIPEEHPIFSK